MEANDPRSTIAVSTATPVPCLIDAADSSQLFWLRQPMMTYGHVTIYLFLITVYFICLL
jgi:hypothetical protein